MPHSGEDARPVGNRGAVLFYGGQFGQIWRSYRKASAIIVAVSTDWLRRKSCNSA